jgi:hypothetical protein
MSNVMKALESPENMGLTPPGAQANKDAEVVRQNKRFVLRTAFGGEAKKTSRPETIGGAWGHLISGMSDPTKRGRGLAFSALNGIPVMAPERFDPRRIIKRLEHYDDVRDKGVLGPRWRVISRKEMQANMASYTRFRDDRVTFEEHEATEEVRRLGGRNGAHKKDSSFMRYTKNGKDVPHKYTHEAMNELERISPGTTCIMRDTPLYGSDGKFLAEHKRSYLVGNIWPRLGYGYASSDLGHLCGKEGLVKEGSASFRGAWALDEFARKCNNAIYLNINATIATYRQSGMAGQSLYILVPHLRDFLRALNKKDFARAREAADESVVRATALASFMNPDVALCVVLTGLSGGEIGQFDDPRDICKKANLPPDINFVRTAIYSDEFGEIIAEWDPDSMACYFMNAHGIQPMGNGACGDEAKKAAEEGYARNSAGQSMVIAGHIERNPYAVTRVQVLHSYDSDIRQLPSTQFTVSGRTPVDPYAGQAAARP